MFRKHSRIIAAIVVGGGLYTNCFLRVLIGLLMCMFFPLSSAEATVGSYSVSEQNFNWVDTDRNRTKATSAEYRYTYGDEASVLFNLPWPFSYYSGTYNQITADTNGNIWFLNTEASHSFNLDNTGRGPVIASWHDDLSSYYYGGVFIQHKTVPEDCIVVEWLTETYSEEGYFLPNNFEIVLYPNGRIEMNYKSFATPSGTDNGSGVSKGDGTDYTDLVDFGLAYTLANRSFSFVRQAQMAQVQVNFLGNGQGSVISTPSGILCNTDCSSAFSMGSSLTLHAEPLEYSLFGGWSGGFCAGSGDCVLNIGSDIPIGASFVKDTEHQVAVDGNSRAYHPSIQAAYNAASEGDTLRLWGVEFIENVVINREINVNILGGYDSHYLSNDSVTVINGSLSINNGVIQLDRIQIK